MLTASIDKPTQQKNWTLHPNSELHIFTPSHTPILRPYSTAIINNIQELMDSCGFNSTVMAISNYCDEVSYCVTINFPHCLMDAHNEQILQTLHVNDGIDTAVASTLATLIEGGNKNGNPSIASGRCR
jgi:hypothetical protein